MPTTIRLKRVGRKKQAAFRIVVMDSSRAVGGPSIERLGIYNPRTEPSIVKLDAARTLHWLREGAEPSDTVRSILRETGLWERFHQGAAPEDLEEAIVLRGPMPGAQQTSQRPGAGRRVAPEPEPEAEAEEAPEAEAEEAPEAEAEEAPEEEAPEEPEGAKAGTEASDEAREASAVPASEATGEAAPPVPDEEEAAEAEGEAEDAGDEGEEEDEEEEEES